MIGPEMAYSAGLEAAAKAAGIEFYIEALEIDNATPPWPPYWAWPQASRC
jgi:predicted glycosyl hydrolase (DUF1957 family)